MHLFLSSVILMSSVIHWSDCIYCYSCDSSSDFSCSEYWDPSNDVNSEFYSDCADVYDAKYCVKMAGVFDGKLGTKRFCSSRDWGDYCEYIQRPGDPREYRSCIFTCSTHGCNGAPVSKISMFTFIGLFLISNYLK